VRDFEKEDGPVPLPAAVRATPPVAWNFSWQQRQLAEPA